MSYSLEAHFHTAIPLSYDYVKVCALSSIKSLHGCKVDVYFYINKDRRGFDLDFHYEHREEKYSSGYKALMGVILDVQKDGKVDMSLSYMVHTENESLHNSLNQIFWDLYDMLQGDTIGTTARLILDSNL